MNLQRELSCLISKIRIPERADEIAETPVWQARNESRSRDGTTDAGAAPGLNPILSGDGLVNGAAQAQQGASPNRRANGSAGRIRVHPLRRMCDVHATDPCREVGDGGIRSEDVSSDRSIEPRRFSLESLNSRKSPCLKSAACGTPPRRAYRPCWRRGRVAEGGGLLNRYRVVKPYRGFESLRLRQFQP